MKVALQSWVQWKVVNIEIRNNVFHLEIKISQTHLQTERDQLKIKMSFIAE